MTATGVAVIVSIYWVKLHWGGRAVVMARYCEFPVTMGRRASGWILPCLASRMGCLP